MYMYLFLPHYPLCCVCHAPPLQELMLSQAFSAPAIFLIVIGVMLFIIGFCGCFGALLEIFYLLVIVSLTHTLTIATVALHILLSLSFSFSLSLSFPFLLHPPPPPPPPPPPVFCSAQFRGFGRSCFSCVCCSSTRPGLSSTVDNVQLCLCVCVCLCVSAIIV